MRAMRRNPCCASPPATAPERPADELRSGSEAIPRARGIRRGSALYLVGAAELAFDLVWERDRFTCAFVTHRCIGPREKEPGGHDFWSVRVYAESALPRLH